MLHQYILLDDWHPWCSKRLLYQVSKQYLFAHNLRIWCSQTNTHTHTTVLRPFFRDHLGEPVPEEKLLDFIVQGKINRGRHIDHPAGCHSIGTNQCPHSPSPIFTGRMPFLPPNQQCQSTEGSTAKLTSSNNNSKSLASWTWHTFIWGENIPKIRKLHLRWHTILVTRDKFATKYCTKIFVNRIWNMHTFVNYFVHTLL